MTATPGSAALLALADKYAREAAFLDGAIIDEIDIRKADEYRKVEYALRIAAKPDEEGVREATIEECAQLVENTGLRNPQNIARDIRALSTTGHPKP